MTPIIPRRVWNSSETSSLPRKRIIQYLLLRVRRADLIANSLCFLPRTAWAWVGCLFFPLPKTFPMDKMNKMADDCSPLKKSSKKSTSSFFQTSRLVRLTRPALFHMAYTAKIYFSAVHAELGTMSIGHVLSNQLAESSSTSKNQAGASESEDLFRCSNPDPAFSSQNYFTR